MKARSHWKRATRVCRCCVCGHVSINQTVCWRRAGWYQMLACENAEFVLLPLRQSWTKRQGRSSLRNTSVANRTSRRPAVPSGPSRAAGSSSTSLEASWKPVSQLRYESFSSNLSGFCAAEEKTLGMSVALYFLLDHLWAFVSQAFRDSPLPWQGISSPGEEATSWTAWTSGTMLGAGAWTWTWSSFTSTPSTGWSASSCSASSVTSSFLLFDRPAADDIERRKKKLIQLHKTATCSWNSFLGCLFSECLSVQV